MKKTVVLILAALFLMASGTAFAAERPTTMELFVGMGTEPDNDLGVGYGFGAGLNVPFDSVFSTSVQELMLRTDISYFHWDDNGLEATRVPVFLGVRYFIPTDVIRAQALGIFVEGGIELSFDGAENPDDEVNFGVPLGFGLQFDVSDSVYLGVSARLHMIKDSYFGLVGTVGFSL